MQHKKLVVLNALTVVALLLALVGVAPTAAVRPNANLARLPDSTAGVTAPQVFSKSSQTAAEPTATSSSDVLVNLKVAPDLREAVRKGDSTTLDVFIAVKAGFDPVPYMIRGFVRPLKVADQQLAFGQIRSIDLLKLLSNDNLVAAEKIDFGKTGSPPPRDPEFSGHPMPVDQIRAHIQSVQGKDVWYSAGPKLPSSPNDWRDVLTDTHKSKLAWDKGFTGAGVTVATLDDGVDFAHPDLQDTYARIPVTTTAWPTSGANPYYDAGAGLTWPYVFSPISALYYAYDYWFGTSYISSCAADSHYVDTSATPATVSLIPGTRQATFTSPCGDTPAHTYIFSATSVSGVYHFGSSPDAHLIDIYDERPAMLVVDEGRFGHASGVYDTVYIDLDNDYDFRDEKPMTIASPEGYRDLWDIDYNPTPDGFADISGGMLAWISDGVNPAPGTDWMWGVVLGPDEGAGDIVELEGPFDSGYSHGTQLTSNIVGQGKIDGYQWNFADVGTPANAVLGHAPDAKVVAMTSIYRNFNSSKLDGWLMAAFGVDGSNGSGDEVQITNNSYGSSDQDNDFWDYDGRFIASLQRNYAPNTIFMISTGNGAPGYGTVTPPTPATGLGICASTQYGSTGWDNPMNASQITSNDIQVWSNRGPGANGANGVDICADGAFAGGIEALNYYGTNGVSSWDTWGGTSRSAPVSVGIMALIYQAYKQAHGVWPDYDTARALIKSSATDEHYDTLVQGAGVLNALRGVEVASGEYGIYVTPDEWDVGDYRGTDYPAFAHVVEAGDTFTKTVTVHNTGSTPITVTVQDGTHNRIGSVNFSRVFTTANETAYTFNAPNYLIPITSTSVVTYQNIAIPANTQLMVVRANFPFDQFDRNGNNATDQQWRLLVYNWTDNNHDSKLWTDSNSNGAVNFTKTNWNGTTCTNIDFFACVTSVGELQAGEYERFGYHRAYANNLQQLVHDPVSRMAEGLFIGLQHPQTASSIPTTTISFQVDFYGITNNSWLSESASSLTVPAGTDRTFVVTTTVPADTAAGIYEAGLYVDDPGDATHEADTAVVPIVINVAKDFTPGDIVTLGGMDAYDDNALYNNAGVQGTFDWSWRAESGDWRFFMLDVPITPTTGTAFIVKDVWNDGYPTDIDTLVMGPTLDPFSNGPDAGNPTDNNLDLRGLLCGLVPCDASDSFYGFFANQDPAYYGPYSESTVGGSPNTNAGAGVWIFNTATNGPEEWVTAPMQEGLHIMAEHNVNFSGAKFTVPFTKTVSSINLNPASVEITVTNNTGSVPITFTTGLTLTGGLVAEGFGLGAPTIYLTQTVTQDNDQNPATDTFNPANGFTNYDFSVEHGAQIDAFTFNATTSDIDMFLFYDADDDGFQYSDLVASSATGSSAEHVTVVDPSDGHWRLSLHGYDVGGGTYNLSLKVVQGFDLSATGLPAGQVNAGAPVQFNLNYAKLMQPGNTYEGLVLLGPDVAPTALAVPVIIHRAGAGTPDLTTSTKTANQAVVPVGAEVEYAIDVTNTGAGSAPAASFVDPIPANTTYVTGSVVGAGATFTPTLGGSGGPAIVWSSSVPTNTTRTITFRVTNNAAAGAVVTNTATISDSVNIPAFGVTQASVAYLSASPLASSIKTATARVGDGGTIVYNIVLNNTSSVAVDTQVGDVLPNGVIATAASGNATVSQDGTEVVWGGTVAAHTSYTVIITSTVDVSATIPQLLAGVPVTNTVSINDGGSTFTRSATTIVGGFRTFMPVMRK